MQKENNFSKSVSLMFHLYFRAYLLLDMCYVKAVDSISGLKDSEYKSALINLCEKVINRLK